MKPLTDSILREAITHFALEGTIETFKRCDIGHINDTFFLYRKGESAASYVLQRINTDVFPRADLVMSNIVAVTSFLQKSIRERGGEVAREAMIVMKTKDGGFYFVNDSGDYFRVYLAVPNGVSIDSTKDPKVFAAGGESFGRFQRDLAAFPAASLYETIPGFHDTPKRFEAFLQAVKDDKAGRAHLCQAAIEKALSLKKAGLRLSRLSPSLPIRVSHNDTKLNNVMFDKDTGESLCPVDLDTVMPGLSSTDFGDAIRFGANTAAEDEIDLSRVHLDMKLFDAYLKGYLRGCGDGLSEEELLSFPAGAEAMTYECGIRFLADYLNGDTYFHITHPTHNLERALSQFALLESMERHYGDMLNDVKCSLAGAH